MGPSSLSWRSYILSLHHPYPGGATSSPSIIPILEELHPLLHHPYPGGATFSPYIIPILEGLHSLPPASLALLELPTRDVTGDGRLTCNGRSWSGHRHSVVTVVTVGVAKHL